VSVLIQPNLLGTGGAGRGLAFGITGSSYEQRVEVSEAMDRLRQNPDMGQVQLEYERTQPQLSYRRSRLAADLASISPTVLQALRWSHRDPCSSRTKLSMQMTSNLTSTIPAIWRTWFVQSGTARWSMASRDAVERAVVLLDREGQKLFGRATRLTPALPLGDAGIVREIDEVPAPENRSRAPRRSGDARPDQLWPVVHLPRIPVVFLVLSAQFESFAVSAVVVMATVPPGSLCAIFAP
jgi:HAE1 family hydrophobic/amphiphilic exporter-1